MGRRLHLMEKGEGRGECMNDDNKPKDMLKRNFLLLLAFCVAFVGYAQKPSDEIAANPRLSAMALQAYPGPKQKVLTPAPAGYKPFYISHYGRHGSRYLCNASDYTHPLNTLLRADSLGMLTATGKEVLHKIQLMEQESHNRIGELTELGALQHKQIAWRMVKRFPEVFAGKAHIDARSTVVIRCILSMENELQQMLCLNPQLRVTHDASHHDMYYMNQSDPKLEKKRANEATRKALADWTTRNIDPTRIMNKLFTDSLYWRHKVDGKQLEKQLFDLAGALQSTELGKSISLYNLFNAHELWKLWEQDNMMWYTLFGSCPLNGGVGPYSQRNLLRNIIHTADSIIARGENGATLRFGHDTMVVPLTCLLGINGYDMQVSDFDKLADSGWVSYRIVPMAANIQFIFYRRNAADKQVLFKVLLNENEATLPLKAVSGPYYRWSDFRSHYLQKLAQYKD